MHSGSVRRLGEDLEATSAYACCTMLRIRVLGTFEAEDESGAVDLGGPRQRAVLALLLVAHGEVVPVDRLIDDLWHGAPPPRAVGALQAYISNLRRALEPHR